MNRLLPLAVMCNEDDGSIHLAVPTGEMVDLPDVIVVELVSVWSTQQSLN